MFCENCGAKLKEDDRFCPECGTPVKVSSDAGREQGQQTYQQPGYDEQQTYQQPEYGGQQPYQQPGFSEQQPYRQPEQRQQFYQQEYQEPDPQRREEIKRRKVQEKKKKNQTVTLVVLGVAVAALLAAVIFGIWMLMKPAKEEEYASPQVSVSPTEEPDEKEDTEGKKEEKEKEDKEEKEEKVTVTATPTPTAEPTPTLPPVTTVKPTPAPAGDFIFPDSNSRYLSYDEVYAKNQQELSYARNEIFARHGRKFKSADLQSYFGSKSWYTPLYEPDEFAAIQDSLFNDYEKENIKQITKVEKDKGYE